MLDQQSKAKSSFPKSWWEDRREDLHVLMDLYTDCLERLDTIGRPFTDANEVGDIVLFKDGNVRRQSLVGGTIEDQE